MKWSVSASKVFLQCPRQWYYGAVFANPKTTSPDRTEACFLKRLQSIHSWRGKLVDQVITRFVVPKLNKHEPVDSDELLVYANNLMQAQLAFANARLYRDSKARATTNDYCALYELEYEGSLTEEAVQRASDEARISLMNLLNSDLFKEFVNDHPYLIAQRPLQFRFANVTVKCTPDLMAFFKDRRPMIIDWKVEAPKYKEHWLQLGIYGVALSRAKPHKDFPVGSFGLTDPTKIGLTEFQLLRNQELKYGLTSDDIVDIEDYIYRSSTLMQRMVNGCGKPEPHIDRLPTPRSPDICVRCKFKKICWKECA